MILNVNNREAQMILAALAVVSPSGGGSPEFGLYRRLSAVTMSNGVSPDVKLEERYCGTVIHEAREAGAI